MGVEAVEALGVVAGDTIDEEAGDVPLEVAGETPKLLVVATPSPSDFTLGPSSSTSPNLPPADTCLGTGYNDDCLAGGTIAPDRRDAFDGRSRNSLLDGLFGGPLPFPPLPLPFPATLLPLSPAAVDPEPTPTPSSPSPVTIPLASAVILPIPTTPDIPIPARPTPTPNGALPDPFPCDFVDPFATGLVDPFATTGLADPFLDELVPPIGALAGSPALDKTACALCPLRITYCP